MNKETPVRRIVVCANVSLDGVMQAPARADEDLRNGFEYGGWAAPYAAMTQAGHVFANADALLLGSGTRLFGETSARAELSLIESTATSNGVVIATYRPGAKA